MCIKVYKNTAMEKRMLKLSDNNYHAVYSLSYCFEQWWINIDLILFKNYKFDIIYCKFYIELFYIVLHSEKPMNSIL